MKTGAVIRRLSCLVTVAMTVFAAVAVVPGGRAGAGSTPPDVSAKPVPFGDAVYLGSPDAGTPAQPVVAMAATPDGKGYWLTGSDGGVYAYGDAGFYGSAGSTALAQPVVAMAATPDGMGYWLASSDGGVYAYGDAGFYGSAGSLPLAAAVIALARTPDGKGYWLTGSDGGVYCFGDAQFFGSTGSVANVFPVVAMSGTADGNGYWLAFADGGVFSYGDASFYGSLGGQSLTVPVVAMVTTPDGAGYWMLPSTPPRPAWEQPGIAIFNLDTAPGSPYAPGQRVVALTFDDGPSPVYTPQILAILVANHVPASFQIIGENGAAYSDLIRREILDGMAVANHTWGHVNLATLPPSAWGTQVDQTDQLLSGVSGQPVRCLRPPGGNTNAGVLSRLGQSGLAELMWDINPSDYLKPGAGAIASRVLGALHPGAIIGMHDGGGDRSQTVAALPAIIAGIRSAGYRIVGVC